MIINLIAKTNCPDLVIDFIEVKLNTGEVVSLNWDESDFTCDGNELNARYKGVYFGEEYGNGRLDEMKDMEIVEFGFYSENSKSTDFEFFITKMEIVDGEDTLVLENLSCEKALQNASIDIN